MSSHGQLYLKGECQVERTDKEKRRDELSKADCDAKLLSSMDTSTNELKAIQSPEEDETQDYVP